ncbi:neutral alpha-glucosidase C-like [Maylandia zebra]|uniref:neutral alpha-glucosidase C-like n=1 Tax=Maylandia zebra TaxID=106582 RepID=UPI00403C3C03
MAEVSQTLASVIPNVEGEGKFKKSGDVAFYRRQIQGANMQHRALLDTMVLTEKGACFELLEGDSQTRLLLSLSPSKPGIVRITIDEFQPIKARYRVPDVLSGEPQCEQLRVEKQTKDSVTFSWSFGRYQLRVWHSPFRLEILCEQEVMVTFNSKDKLWFERLQHRPR